MSITDSPAQSDIASASGSPAGPPAGMPDPRPAFAQAVARARGVVAGIRPDQFDASTPCADYDVRTLTGHVVAVLQRLTIVGAGGSPFDSPDVVTDVADADWLAEFDRHAAAGAAVWSDDAVLTNLLTLPWAQLPGGIAMMIYINEISVHTWDLAEATGQDVAWNDEVLHLAYAAMQRGLPAEGRMEHYDKTANEARSAENSAFVVPPFSAVVPVADDAPLIQKLVAWNGRRPSA